MGRRFAGGCRWLMLEPDVCPTCADIEVWRQKNGKGCRVDEPDKVMVIGDARHGEHMRPVTIPLPNGAMVVA